MDAVYFLKERTAFIRYYYDESAKHFLDLQRKIEDGAPPFDDPPYSEDPEPAFLKEWMDARTALDVLGHSCVSILSDSLKLYFQTFQSSVIGFIFGDSEQRLVEKKGFVAAYRTALGHILQTDWSDCPANFDVIEQVVLARNRGQHGGNLTSFAVTHEAKTLRKHPKPFFASEGELKDWVERGRNENSFFAPRVEVSRDVLFAAAAEIEKLADWVESRLDKAWEWRRNAAGS